MNGTIQQVATWLSTHELVILLLIVAICAAWVVVKCRRMANSVIPSEDEHQSNSVG